MQYLDCMLVVEIYSGIIKLFMSGFYTINQKTPVFWGKVYWDFLHTMAAKYPVAPDYSERCAMTQFLSILPRLIPCKMCRDHIVEYLNVNSGDLLRAVSSREALFQFFWTFHNYVNKRLSKPQISLEVAKQMYGYQAM